MRSFFFRACAIVLVAAFAIGASPPADAQWKWRDRSGRVQYSDRPPPADTPDADVLQRPQATDRRPAAAVAASAASSPPLAAPPAPKASEPELEARRRRAEQDEAARKKADEDRLSALRAENCARAMNQLRALEAGLRMARINPNGEREVLDDEARAAEAQRARGIVASDCR